MTYKTRKHIWPVPLVASIAILGMLAAFLVLANNPGVTMAQDGDPCAGMTDDERSDHILDGGTCGDQTEPTTGDPLAAVPEPMYFNLDSLDNGARLSWHALPDSSDYTVMGYQIDRKVYHSDAAILALLRSGGGDATIDIGVMQQYRDLGLSYGTTYTYQVRAYVSVTDADGESMMGHGPWSRERTTVTADAGGRLAPLLDAPTAVQMLDAAAACANSITVSWQAPAHLGTVSATDGDGMYVGPDYIGGEGAGKEEVGKPATSVIYKVERMVGTGAWAMVAHTDTMYMDTNVAYGNTYKYRVRAMNGARLYGPWMMVSETLTEPPAPQAPRSLRVNLEEDQLTFELQWSAPPDPDGLWRTSTDFNAADAAGDYLSDKLQYVVQRKINDGEWSTISTQPHQYSSDGLSTTFEQEHIHEPTDISAIRGATVRFRVSALVDDCNKSNWNQADEVEVPAATAPEMPTGLTATPMGQNQIDLSWTAPADGGSPITGYTFEYSTDGGTTWSDPAATDSMTGHSHTGLMAATTYTYRVTAMNAVGSSMASATDDAMTAAAPTVNAPAITAASSDAAGSATITLTPSANATKHFVWAFRVGGTDNAADGKWSDEAAGDATSVTITGLTSGASYWFIAIAGSGEGAATTWSNWSGWTAATAIQ